MLKNLKLAGKYIVGAGIAATFLMAIVGTVSIDIVLLAYLIKKSNENNSGVNGFLTGYFFSSMFSANLHHHNHDKPFQQLLSNLILLVASPFLTGVAIGLSFLLGVPQVGIVLALGWGISLGIVGLGAGIIKLADVALEYFNQTEANPINVNEPVYHPINGTYNYFNHVLRDIPQNYPNHPIAQAPVEAEVVYLPAQHIPHAQVVRINDPRFNHIPTAQAGSYEM